MVCPERSLRDLSLGAFLVVTVIVSGVWGGREDFPWH